MSQFKSLEPFIPCFHPRIPCSLRLEVVVHFQHPFSHQLSGRLHRSTIYDPLSLNPPIFPLDSHPALDCLVDAHIYGLAQISRDVDYLNPKRLDSVDYSSHHVDAIGVKNERWDYTWWLHVFPWDKHTIDTPSNMKQCCLKWPCKHFLWYFFLSILYCKELTKAIEAKHCASLRVSVIAEVAEIKEMGEWRRSLFNWRNVNVDSEWGNGLFCAKRPVKIIVLGGNASVPYNKAHRVSGMDTNNFLPW